MKRSSKTDAQGQFTTRPVNPASIWCRSNRKRLRLQRREVRQFPRRASGRHVRRADDQCDGGFGAQAVCYSGHSTCVDQRAALQTKWRDLERVLTKPARKLTGTIWIRAGKKTAKGAYQLMAPHGLRNVRLRFYNQRTHGFDGAIRRREACRRRHLTASRHLRKTSTTFALFVTRRQS